MFVNRSSELMQPSFTLSQCVKICQQDCTRDGSLTLICRVSRLDIIELAIFRTWSWLSIKIQDQNKKLRAFLHLENRKKKSAVLLLMVTAITVKQYSKQWDVTTTSVPVKKPRPSLTEQYIERGNKKREMDDMRREYIKEKGYKVMECRSVTSGINSKPMTRSKITSEPTFPLKDLFPQTPFKQKKSGSLFGYIQCDLVVPDELKSQFANFPPIVKNTEVGRNDFGDYMNNYAIENEILKYPHRIADFEFEARKWNGYNFSVQLLVGAWLATHQNLPFFSVYSTEMFQ